MALRINDIAPDFTAESIHGTLKFHDWLGQSWGVLFSHPKDFTPVCTTELGALAALQDDFAARNTKVIGLSVNPVDDHMLWLDDIKDATGHKPEYPIIADRELAIAKLYDMLPATLEGNASGPCMVHSMHTPLEGVLLDFIQSDVSSVAASTGSILRTIKCVEHARSKLLSSGRFDTRELKR